MPTIKLKLETKLKLDCLMAEELKKEISSCKGKQKANIFLKLIKNKYGITYDIFLNKLIEGYTKNTK